MPCLKMFDPLNEGPAIGIEASALRKVSKQLQSLSQLSSSCVRIARSDGFGSPWHFGTVAFGSQIQVLLQGDLDAAIAGIRWLSLIQDRFNVSCTCDLLRNKFRQILFFGLNVDAELQMFGINSPDSQIRDVPHRRHGQRRIERSLSDS